MKMNYREIHELKSAAEAAPNAAKRLAKFPKWLAPLAVLGITVPLAYHAFKQAKNEEPSGANPERG